MVNRLSPVTQVQAAITLPAPPQDSQKAEG